MKVYRSVGAFDVYSPTRAASLLAGTAVLIAGAGFVGGVLVEKDSGSSSSSNDHAAAVVRPAPVTAPPAAAKTAAKPSQGAALSSTSGGGTAYKRGFQNGLQAVVGDPSGFKAGGTYMVRLTPGRNGAPFTIGPRVTVAAGNIYSLCRNGQHICTTQGSLAGAP
jgi:hypothetical protein